MIKGMMNFVSGAMGFLISLTLLLTTSVIGSSLENPIAKYWLLRSNLLKEENSRMLGSDLVLEGRERNANVVLMRAKYKELDEAIKDPNQFLPMHSFLVSAEKIRQSPVYQMIQSMPKGSVLHVHDLSMTSSEYVFSNITFRSNIFACDIDNDLKLKFFDKPDNECNWRLLREWREKDKHIDDRIREKLTMHSKQPNGGVYPTTNAAWQKFSSIFRFLIPILSYRPVFEDYAYQGFLEHHNDNVLYAEVRTLLPPLYDLDGTEYKDLEVAKIYKNVVDRFMNDHPDFVGVKLIYAPTRRCEKVEFQKYLKTADKLKKELPNFVAGFDLVGQEDQGQPLMKFAQELRSLGNEDVHFFFHAGETNWYGTSVDENLVDAVLLNTKRIGHGIATLKHPTIMEMVRLKKIPIEISPISNQVLMFVQDLRSHPATMLFADNYPVVVSNDDPGLWGATGLSYDFYEAFVGIMSRKADLRALKKLALNSIEYSSMDEEQKKKALRIWNERWNEFVKKLKESAK